MFPFQPLKRKSLKPRPKWLKVEYWTWCGSCCTVPGGAGFGCWFWVPVRSRGGCQAAETDLTGEQWKNMPVSVTKCISVPRQMVQMVVLSGGFLERCF